MSSLIENYYKSQRDNLVRSISRRAGSTPNAEDVVQEAFLRALKYSGSFSPKPSDDIGEALASWFKTIMYRSLADFLAKERNQGMTITEEEEEEGTDTAEDSWAMKVGLKGVHKLIKDKPEAIKKTLELAMLYGYRCKEISEIVNEPYNTIRARVSRFREELEDYREMYSL